jgi:glucan 1,3-beta-glucosidase
MQKLHGVNLGGWLVLERWVTPGLFDGLKSWDEFGFCEELGSSKLQRIENHRKSFIKAEDFKWLNEKGINTVRIPVGYWIFGGHDPFVGGIEYLDFAMEAAEQNNLGVIIDLHGAPGSQNGWKHSGVEGKVGWHKGAKNIELTLKTIKLIAQRYNVSNNLVGIELLNEPRGEVPFSLLINYCRQGYQTVREHCDENVAVIVSDAFKPRQWQHHLLTPEYINVWLDCHLYQVFDPKDNKLNLSGHVNKIMNEWGPQISEAQLVHPVLVGEWSAALGGKTVEGLNEEQQNHVYQQYFNYQVATFSQAQGWFYWTYKTESDSPWCLRCMIDKGIFSI